MNFNYTSNPTKLSYNPVKEIPMRIKSKLVLLLACAALILATPVWADVPENMNVQGRLTDAAGDPLPAGFKIFTFKIWDAEVGGTEVWPGGPGENQTIGTDDDGLWTAQVGKLLGLTDAVFQDTTRWLEVTIDDNVNPVETLPRIKLNTNPFTYRAATSQDADAVEGMNVADLMDKFVDETGDAMTGSLSMNGGQISNTTTNKNNVLLLGPNISAVNRSDGYFDHFASVAGTWGVQGDAAGDGILQNIGVGGAGQGNSTSNFGVVGFGGGTDNTSLNYGVYGAADGGIKNWGVYSVGPLEVVAAAHDSSVVLPDDAISASEILDEPGITVQLNSSFISLTTVMQDLETVTITIPSSGYILLHGKGYGLIGGTTGVVSGYAQIDETAGGGFLFPFFTFMGRSAHYSSTATTYVPYYCTRTYFKTAGVYTFRLEGNTDGGVPAGTLRSAVHSLTAVFYPTSYGAVATVLASSDAAEFQSARSSGGTSGTGAGAEGGTATDLYEVDLRDLEMRVLRAEAEAEKAKRELLEAKFQVGQPRILNRAVGDQQGDQ